MQRLPLLRKKPIVSLERPHEGPEPHGLKRVLTARDLMALGIAAIIGAGIFSTIGNAAFYGGPAVAVLFVFTAIACGFTALCYAEFASRVPVAGSAYTYAYTAFGELLAWIIGWDLLLEYAIGNIAVAVSWSDYFSGFLAGWGFDFPAWLSTDFLSAQRAFAEFEANAALPEPVQVVETEYLRAWLTAPTVAGIPFIIDLPALVIVLLITWLVYRGIRESRNFNNLMVLLKLLILGLVVAVGFVYVNPDNWVPFAPNGIGGLLKGISAIFFAYIGFDAISTVAEETRNPERDMPWGIIGSLIVCTVIYILVAMTITGVVHYTQLQVGDPLAFIFRKAGLGWANLLVSGSAIIAMASVLLVFQIGQPRILFSMSRDGLLPPAFSRISPRFKTPSFATWMTGVMVAVPALFMNLTELTDLTVIGTLFAFILVCAGILVVPKSEKPGHFTVPFVAGRVWMLPVLALVSLMVYYGASEEVGLWWQGFLEGKDLADSLPVAGFLIFATGVIVLTVVRNLSLIPVMGLLSCSFLMAQLGATNWVRFLIWMGVGLLVYFFYSIRHSKLAPQNVNQK